MNKIVTLVVKILGTNWFCSNHFSFCRRTFKRFFNLGDAEIVDFHITDRKPRDKDYYELTRIRDEGANQWNLTDSPTEGDNSPHEYAFDIYLNETFPSVDKVYVSAYV